MAMCSRLLPKVNTFFLFSLQTRVVSTLLYKNHFRHFSTPQECVDFGNKHDADIVITKVISAKTETEVFQSLAHDFDCNTIQITHTLITRLLHRFQDDWKSAMGVFRWAEACSGYKPSPELYDKMVDILGKSKQLDKMKAFVQEMCDDHLVSLSTVAKAMRRFSGAGQWKDAVNIFEELENFGLKKNTEAMNLLLDTLCKERKVEQARALFLEMKPNIPPNANTYNIFIHGWCKIRRVEEAQWTIEEMKGQGFRPCVISYSIIIQSYCSQSNFHKVYELLDEMEEQGCPANVVTFTNIMHSLTRSGEIEEALQIGTRMKVINCKPDTQFYNALIHTLGKGGRVEEALTVFTKEMPESKVYPNTSTYNSMIAMFCHHKQEQRALEYLRNLEKSVYCKPDVQSFYALLKLYFRDGKADKCMVLLDDIVKKHHLCLDLATYTLLIHGLCRANKCESAYQLFGEMIGQNIKPRYLTCKLLLQEIKEKNMYSAAEVIEGYMKKMKSL